MNAARGIDTHVRSLRKRWEAGAISKRFYLNALETYYKLHFILVGIQSTMERPGSQPVTSLGLRQRADKRQQYATQIKLNGGGARREYQ